VGLNIVNMVNRFAIYTTLTLPLNVYTVSMCYRDEEEVYIEYDNRFPRRASDPSEVNSFRVCIGVQFES